MILGLETATAFNALAGLLHVAVGAFVLYLNPRRGVNRAFAAFAIAEGALVALSIVARLGRLDPLVWAALFNHLRIGQELALVAVALLYPRPLARSRMARVLAVPVILGVTYATIFVSRWGFGSDGPYLTATWVLLLALPAVHHVLPARLAADPDARAELPTIARLAAILLLVDGISNGFVFIWNARGGAELSLLAEQAFEIVGIAALWLWAAARAPPREHARAARNVALWALALPTGTMLAVAILTPRESFEWSLYAFVRGGARLLFLIALAYAVLRHQLLGLDVKARWTISRGTVAAAFVAAFFVASEGAQILLGQGNEWVGLLGAGALVFALAPLQRAAERLAEKAVPVAPPPVPATGDAPRATGRDVAAHEAAYQAAVRLALRGGITRAEERDLAWIAEAHGLSHVRARELREEIEDAWSREEIA